MADGTAAGTRAHGDLRPGIESSFPEYLGVGDSGIVVFTADNDTSSRQPWYAPQSGPVVLLVDGAIRELSPTRSSPATACSTSASRPNR